VVGLPLYRTVVLLSELGWRNSLAAG